MRGTVRVLPLALLLVLAGCVGPFAGGDQPSPSDAGPGTPTDAPAGAVTDDGSGTTTDERIGTTTPVAGGSADNPFGQAVVPVWVNDTVGDGRDTTALVATAIDYWNGRIDRYTAFDYRFRLVDDREDARVEVRFVEEIDQCGRDHDVRTVGCAPLLEAGDTAPDLANARVELHGSNSAVVGTIQHELGHVLGLRHDDEPLVVMGQLANVSVTDASDRAVPWYANDLSVYVDHDSLDGDRETITDQVDHALGYYDDGAAGTIPDNVTFTRTDHRPSADVVISNDPQYACGGQSGSAGWVYQGVGHVDTDDAMEMYTRSIICVDVREEDAFGWYVGYFLGRGMGLEETELADPFRDADYWDRRSDWWE